MRDICGREEGAPPPVDLAAERRNGDFVRGLIAQGLVSAVHDVSDGGLAVALAEMAMAGGVGAHIRNLDPRVPAHAMLFGEDQARYVVTASTAASLKISAAAAKAGVEWLALGVTGGDALVIAGESVAIAALRAAHEGWLPGFMGG